MKISKSLNLMMNYGAIIGMALIAYGLLIYLLGIEYDNSIAGLVSYGIMLGGLAFFLRKYRNEQNDGYLSFGESFKLGFLIMVFASILGAFYNWVFISFINPSMIETIKQKSYEQYIAMGMSEEAAVEALEQAIPFLTPGWMMFFGFIGYLIMGAIFALIISFFIKRDNPNPSFD